MNPHPRLRGWFRFPFLRHLEILSTSLETHGNPGSPAQLVVGCLTRTLACHRQLRRRPRLDAPSLELRDDHDEHQPHSAASALVVHQSHRHPPLAQARREADVQTRNACSRGGGGEEELQRRAECLTACSQEPPRLLLLVAKRTAAAGRGRHSTGRGAEGAVSGRGERREETHALQLGGRVLQRRARAPKKAQAQRQGLPRQK